MKRFLLFGGGEYYPTGGISDLLALGDTVEEAKRDLEQTPDHKYRHPPRKGQTSGTDCDWWHVYDCVEGVVVEWHSGNFSGSRHDKDSIEIFLEQPPSKHMNVRKRNEPESN